MTCVYVSGQPWGQEGEHEHCCLWDLLCIIDFDVKVEDAPHKPLHPTSPPTMSVLPTPQAQVLPLLLTVICFLKLFHSLVADWSLQIPAPVWHTGPWSPVQASMVLWVAMSPPLGLWSLDPLAPGKLQPFVRCEC